ncbi:hypothetical protein Tco_0456527 [Tanacetum coccineum]
MQTLVATLFLQGLPSVISLLQYSEIDYLGSRWYRASELCGRKKLSLKTMNEVLLLLRKTMRKSARAEEDMKEKKSTRFGLNLKTFRQAGLNNGNHKLRLPSVTIVLSANLIVEWPSKISSVH